jgi:hypothetical protein
VIRFWQPCLWMWIFGMGLFSATAASDRFDDVTREQAALEREELAANQAGKIYEAFGTTRQHEHGAFACWSLGITIWGDDVLDFVDAAMKLSPHQHVESAPR